MIGQEAQVLVLMSSQALGEYLVSLLCLWEKDRKSFTRNELRNEGQRDEGQGHFSNCGFTGS